MTSQLLALARRAVRLFGVVTIAAALGTGVAIGQAPAKKLSYPKQYQSAVAYVRDLIWDIDEEAYCEDLPGVEREVTAAKDRLKGLLEKAFIAGDSVAFYVLDAALDDLEDTFDYYKRGCSGHISLRLKRVRFFVDGSFLSQDSTGNKQRLAHDVNNTIHYDFGNVDPRSSGGGFRIGTEIPVQRIGKTNYFLAGTYGFTSLSSSASGSANGPFNAPGLGVGTNPNGFSTNSNNAVSYQYESDSIRHEFDLSAATRFRSGPVYFSPRIGGIFGVYTLDDKYTFNRPSPPSTFAGNYTTNSTVYTVGPYVQLGIDYRIPQSNVTLFGTGKAGFDYNWAKSNVSFELTSPSAFAELQNVSISDTKYTPNLSLEGGFKVDFGPWDAYLKGGIQYGRYVPNISIPGGGSLPMLNGETETEYSITAGLKADLSRLDKKPRRQISYSDVRLKRDIAQVGRLANGLRLYRYRYRWSDTVYVGVMAQEVALLKPNAVLRGPDGFLRVDYGRLGLRMMTWDEWLATGACVKFPAAISDCRLEDETG